MLTFHCHCHPVTALTEGWGIANVLIFEESIQAKLEETETKLGSETVAQEK